MTVRRPPQGLDDDISVSGLPHGGGLWSPPLHQSHSPVPVNFLFGDESAIAPKKALDQELPLLPTSNRVGVVSTDRSRLPSGIRRRLSATFDFFRNRALNNLPGGRFVPVYFDRKDAHELDRSPYIPTIASENVVGHFGADVSRPLRRYIGNVFMDGPLLLAEWQTQLAERGITITRTDEQRGPLPPYADANFTSTLASYNLDAPDVVMNCAGYGARDLCGDKEVYRLVGHLIMLQKPEYQRHHNYVLSDYISDDPSRAVYYHCREHQLGYGMIGGTFIPVREGAQGPNGEDIDDNTGLPIDNEAEWEGVIRRFTTYVTRRER